MLREKFVEKNTSGKSKSQEGKGVGGFYERAKNSHGKQRRKAGARKKGSPPIQMTIRQVGSERPTQPIRKRGIHKRGGWKHRIRHEVKSHSALNADFRECRQEQSSEPAKSFGK